MLWLAFDLSWQPTASVHDGLEMRLDSQPPFYRTLQIYPESSLTPRKWSSLHRPLKHCTGLLVCQWIHLKILLLLLLLLLLVYKVQSGFEPKYISDLLVRNDASTTFSDRFCLVLFPWNNTKQGEEAFSFSSLHLCNKFPEFDLWLSNTLFSNL